jgi:hypothetical protein
MVFNDASAKLGLIQDISFLTGVDINKYPLADRTRNINSWNSKVWSWVFEAYGGWQFDDDNSSAPTTTPSGTINLFSGTSVYGLPTGALTVRKVDILQSDGVSSISLEPLPLEKIGVAEAEFLKTAGTPRFYRLVGDVIKLYPGPNYSGTSYLKVFFDREMLAFDAADTTEVPGFAAPFHRILSIGASLDYAIANGVTNKINTLSNEVLDYEKRIKKFYSKRFLANFPTNMSVRDSIRQYQ